MRQDGRSTPLRLGASTLACVLFISACSPGAAPVTSTEASPPPSTAAAVTTTTGLATTTSTTAPANSRVADAPQVRPVHGYVMRLGIDPDEASRRNALVETFEESQLERWLDRTGHLVWVRESRDDWTLVVGTTGSVNEARTQVSRLTTGTPFGGLVEIRSVDHSQHDLDAMEEFLRAHAAAWCIEPPSAIEYRYGDRRPVIIGEDKDSFLAGFRRTGLDLEGTNGLEIKQRRTGATHAIDNRPCEAPTED